MARGRILTPKNEAPDGSLPRLLRWAVASSLLLFALRWSLVHRVGFGDAEALYAAYALHPQPAYLDHPGLVGMVARWICGDDLPTAERIHRFTAVASTMLPWVGVLAARAAGAVWRNAIPAYFALALLPELVVGSFALTPDLLLAYFWISALGGAALSLRSPPGSVEALVGALFAGVCTGLACASKATGVLLALSLFVVCFARSSRAHLRTAAPWLGMGVALVFVAPVVLWEWRLGFPMLRHRLVATQAEAGLSLRNLGAFVGGQLLYVTPPFLLAAFYVFRSLWKDRRQSPALLYVAASAVPAVPLVALCLWSRVAEAHWLGPAYLALALGVGHAPVVRKKLALACGATGALVAVLGFVWVATTVPIKILRSGYVARYDLSNDLYAWGPGSDLLRETVASVRNRTGRDPVVVGPHYIVCAQAHVALGPGIPVGCRTPSGDDFEHWYPPRTWNRAATLLFVSDDRFDVDPARELPDYTVVDMRRVAVMRGGHKVRTIAVTLLEKGSDVAFSFQRFQLSARNSRLSALRPAASSNSVSPSGSGFGVVSRRSP